MDQPNKTAPPAADGPLLPLVDRHANNFDFIRLALSTLVIVSHCPQLIDGNASREPLSRITADGLTLGALAVNGFFLLSGFLIVQSWLFTDGVLTYLKKRILRIYPAFVVAGAISILVVGALGAAHALAYWQAMDTHYQWFAFKRLFSLRVPGTPPTFDGLHFPSVNGSIWTVRYEFFCYLMVVAMGWAGVFGKRIFTLVLTLAAYLTFAAQSYGLLSLSDSDVPLVGVISNWPRFATYFLTGACFYLFREKLRWNWKLAAGSAALLALGCAFQGGSAVVLPIFGAYLLFYFGFVDAGALRHFGKHGDFSYGLFCYGWPVQTLILWWFGGKMHPVLLLALSFPAALALAFCSWHVVERPCLRLKGRKLFPHLLSFLKPSRKTDAA